MKINILKSAKDAIGQDFKSKNVVVIDTLRATTVIVTALQNGAKSIYPFKEIEDAKKKKKLNPNGILAGERRGVKVEGFDLANSPLEFTENIVRGKEIFMTTSNGTRAIENALSADNLYIACYLNISAISKKIVEEKKDTVILCAGTDNEFSLDDSLCAGLIANNISKKIAVEMDDFTLSLKKLAEYFPTVKQVLEGSKHYSYLKQIGHEKDLEYCIKIDTCEIVPFYVNGKIKSSS